MNKKEYLKKLMELLKDIFSKVGSFLVVIVALLGVIYFAWALFGFCIDLHGLAINAINEAVDDLRFLYSSPLGSWVDVKTLKYSIYGVIMGSAGILLAMYLAGLAICWKVLGFMVQVYGNIYIERLDSIPNETE